VLRRWIRLPKIENSQCPRCGVPLGAFYASGLVIEEAQIVVHEGHQPDFLGDLLMLTA